MKYFITVYPFCNARTIVAFRPVNEREYSAVSPLPTRGKSFIFFSIILNGCVPDVNGLAVWLDTLNASVNFMNSKIFSRTPVFLRSARYGNIYETAGRGDDGIDWRPITAAINRPRVPADVILVSGVTWRWVPWPSASVRLPLKADGNLNATTNYNVTANPRWIL